ncbi:MAG: 50S ribosomal protein L4 [Chlamydiales bacterium]|nr:50S ribosomal protein L4 [Chlamydiales bacterium]
MATVKKFNLSGKELGTVEINKELVEAEANGQMIKDYIIALRANARQWSASTKTRAEVRHTTKKPFAQKGTGQGRAGTLVAPHHRGGGRAHGPRPKFDQHIRLNKKERRAAIRALLAEKLRDNRVIVLEDTKLSAPKTKSIATFLQAAGLVGRTLILGEGNYEKRDTGAIISTPCHQHDNFIKSVNNIPRVEFQLARNTSGYDLLIAHDIVVTAAALQEINEWLS